MYNVKYQHVTCSAIFHPSAKPMRLLWLYLWHMSWIEPSLWPNIGFSREGRKNKNSPAFSTICTTKKPLTEKNLKTRFSITKTSKRKICFHSPIFCRGSWFSWNSFLNYLRRLAAVTSSHNFSCRDERSTTEMWTTDLQGRLKIQTIFENRWYFITDWRYLAAFLHFTQACVKCKNRRF